MSSDAFAVSHDVFGKRPPAPYCFYSELSMPTALGERSGFYRRFLQLTQIAMGDGASEPDLVASFKLQHGAGISWSGDFMAQFLKNASDLRDLFRVGDGKLAFCDVEVVL
jgi:hypothetical protein